MAIKIDNNTPNDIVWKEGNTTYTVAAIKRDGTWVYARKGTYTVSTLPEGVNSLGASYTKSTYEPTDSNKTLLAIGGTVYHGGTINYTATASQYWSITYNTSATVNFLSTTSVNGVNHSGIAASRKSREFIVTVATEGVASITAYYTNTTAGTKATVTYSSAGTYLPPNVWQGGLITWSASAAQYWTMIDPSGTIEAGTGAVGITPEAERTPRAVTITRYTGVSPITVSYTNLLGDPGSHSYSASASPDYMWQGGTISWTAQPLTYYSLTATSGSISAGTSAYTIAPKPSRLAGTVNYSQGTGIASTTISYYKSSSESSTADASVTVSASTTSIAADVWQGGQLSWSSTAAAYYTGSSGTVGPSSSTRYIVVAGSRKMRNIVVKSVPGVANTVLSYANAAGTPTSGTTTTATATYSAWCGYTSSWVATAARGYTLVSGSGTIDQEDTTATYTVTPTVSINQYNVTIGGGRAATRYGVSASSATISVVSSGSFNYSSTVYGYKGINTSDLSYVTIPSGWVKQSGTAAAESFYRVGSVTVDAVTTNYVPYTDLTLLTRTMNVIKNTNIESIKVTYYNSDGALVTATYSASSTGTAWIGRTITYTPTASTYWTATTRSIAPSTSTSSVFISPTANRRARNAITYSQGSGISSTIFSYTNTSGVATSTSWSTATTSIAANVWRGSDVTWKTTPAQYWATVSGTLAAEDINTGYIAPSPARLARTVTITKGYGITLTAAYTATGSGSVSSKSWGPTVSYSGSSSLLTDLWQGGYITWNASVTATGTWAAFIDNYGESVTQATRGSNSIGPGTNTITISAYLQTGKTTLTYNNSSNVSWTSTTQINNGTTKTLACANALASNTGNTWKDKAITIKGYWYPTASSSASLGTSYSFTASLPLTNTTKTNSVTLATYNSGGINHQLKAYRLYPRNVSGNPVLVMWINVSSGTNVSYTRVRITNISATGYCDSTGQPVAPENCSLSGSELNVYNGNPYPCDVYLTGSVLTSEGNQYNFNNQYVMTISPYTYGATEILDQGESADDANLGAYFAGQSYKSSTSSYVDF